MDRKCPFVQHMWSNLNDFFQIISRKYWTTKEKLSIITLHSLIVPTSGTVTATNPERIASWSYCCTKALSSTRTRSRLKSQSVRPRTAHPVWVRILLNRANNRTFSRSETEAEPGGVREARGNLQFATFEWMSARGRRQTRTLYCP